MRDATKEVAEIFDAMQARLSAAADENERLRAALAWLVSDLNDRAQNGLVDCSASAWDAANNALAPGAGEKEGE